MSDNNNNFTPLFCDNGAKENEFTKTYNKNIENLKTIFDNKKIENEKQTNDIKLEQNTGIYGVYEKSNKIKNIGFGADQTKQLVNYIENNVKENQSVVVFEDDDFVYRCINMTVYTSGYVSDSIEITISPSFNRCSFISITPKKFKIKSLLNKFKFTQSTTFNENVLFEFSNFSYGVSTSNFFGMFSNNKNILGSEVRGLFSEIYSELNSLGIDSNTVDNSIFICDTIKVNEQMEWSNNIIYFVEVEAY